MQGFTGRAPLSLVQDREGAVWIGTERGLDRFRPTRVQAVALDDSATAALVAGADGSVWIGRWNSPPVRVDGPGLHELPQGAGTSRGPRICAVRDPKGAVWLCGVDNLWHIDGDKVEPVPYPEALPLSLFVQAIAVGPDGTLWMASARGLHRRTPEGQWQQAAFPTLAGLGVPNAVAVDDAGRLLLGYAGARLAVLSGDQLRVLSPAQGLGVGDVKAITPVQGRYWVGGSEGVALCRELSCRMLVLDGRAELNGVSGIVESRRGELWLNGAEGITRIGASHLQAVMREPAYEPLFERFDSDDGLDGTPSQVRPMATAAEGVDGRLWFTTSTNLYVIDPVRLPRNALAPPVLIRELKSGEVNFGKHSGLKLPQWAKSVSIRYTALSLAIPDRVRFRYRLSGVDDDWRDAGGRREVTYTNLEPRDYRFDVIASNEDGVWNETGASLGFSIEPAFHQTALFKAIAAALVLVLVYALYAWRIRVANERTRQRLEERMAERERIARDLHDTLLQGMQAVVLLLQAALGKVARDNALHEQLERLINHTERVLVEGRDRVHQLRESGQAHMLGALELFAEELVREHKKPAFQARMAGAPRNLHPVVHDEVLNIAREAIANAMAHANAQRVELRMEYGRSEFRLTVADDGVGIDAGILGAGFRSGHWGLVGMRERALKIDGRLELRSIPQAGTTVELRVPARVAYLRPKTIAERLRGWHLD
jgi:signal transduction histidine kinase